LLCTFLQFVKGSVKLVPFPGCNHHVICVWMYLRMHACTYTYSEDFVFRLWNVLIASAVDMMNSSGLRGSPRRTTFVCMSIFWYDDDVTYSSIVKVQDTSHCLRHGVVLTNNFIRFLYQVLQFFRSNAFV
jgi:hypothetical protein